MASKVIERVLVIRNLSRYTDRLDASKMETDREELTECPNSINRKRIYENEDYFYVHGSCCRNDLVL